MICVDSRIGSADLAPKLAALNLPVELTTLDFADVAFCGQGPDGAAVTVGVELKKLPDLLGSFASGRLISHQVPGLLDSFDAVWLIVEGRYRAGASGLLESGYEKPWRDGSIVRWNDAGYGQRRWMYREIESRLTTLELKAGIRVKRTGDGDETVAAIAALYDWFTTREWDEHTSHIAEAMKYVRPSMGGVVPLAPPTLCEKVAAQLPGIGANRAAMVAGKFQTVFAMINAEANIWSQMPGIGKTIATNVFKAVRGQM